MDTRSTQTSDVDQRGVDKGRPGASEAPAPAPSGMTPHDAMTGRPGHPEESPRGFGKFVTIAAAVILVLAVWFWLA